MGTRGSKDSVKKRRLATEPIRRQFGLRVWHGKPGPPPQFAEVRKRFLRLLAREKRAANPNAGWISEANLRLAQLEWIIARVAKLQATDARLSRRRADSTKDRQKARRRRARLGEEIRLLTEAFYYFAFRLCKIVRKTLKRKFDPVGVRNVRNHLIEHPIVPNYNFAYGADLYFGPVVKPYGSRPKPIHDEGLYRDAQEVIDQLLRLLDRLSRR